MVAKSYSPSAMALASYKCALQGLIPYAAISWKWLALIVFLGIAAVLFPLFSESVIGVVSLVSPENTLDNEYVAEIVKAIMYTIYVLSYVTGILFVVFLWSKYLSRQGGVRKFDAEKIAIRMLRFSVVSLPIICLVVGACALWEKVAGSCLAVFFPHFNAADDEIGRELSRAGVALIFAIPLSIAAARLYQRAERLTLGLGLAVRDGG